MVGSVDVVQSNEPLDHPIIHPWIFLWDAMKDPVYNSKPRSLDDLKIAITTQFNDINSNKELCFRVRESVISRKTKCIEQNGWQFEHLL